MKYSKRVSHENRHVYYVLASHGRFATLETVPNDVKRALILDEDITNAVASGNSAKAKQIASEKYGAVVLEDAVLSVSSERRGRRIVIHYDGTGERATSRFITFST